MQLACQRAGCGGMGMPSSPKAASWEESRVLDDMRSSAELHNRIEDVTAPSH
jgi:hypothetical protein